MRVIFIKRLLPVRLGGRGGDPTPARYNEEGGAGRLVVCPAAQSWQVTELSLHATSHRPHPTE